jgi:Resolvase, N terminal domain
MLDEMVTARQVDKLNNAFVCYPVARTQRQVPAAAIKRQICSTIKDGGLARQAPLHGVRSAGVGAAGDDAEIVVRVYKDHGISGAKGRKGRPAFDALCRDAARRQFDVIMTWSVDRLGRSLQDLVGFGGQV